MNRCARLTSQLVAGLVLAAPSADAFCGFYVSGADGKLFNDATQVVLMRDGTRTVLSMQNDYKGPPQDFALVIPVPVVLQKENVKTLNADVFKHVDTLSAPRLVEYWEQDPCPTIGLGGIGTLGHGAGTGTGQGFGSGHGRLGGEAAVKIEAQFEVAEYEILILSAKDSGALDAWLRENKYKIPENAEPALKPYVQAGSKFFVAKVNVAKVKFDAAGRATLSPLRFHYDSDKFELPVKLGLLNSSGTQDIIVSILASDRYEVSNYPNVTIPTNLDVTEAARDSFGAFYTALFDRTIDKHPRAVVTEYAWQATNCDPCPGNIQGLTGNDLASLGADVMPNMSVHASGGNPNATMRAGAATVTGRLPPEVIQRIVRQNFGRFRLCYEKGLQANPTLAGRVAIKFVIDGSGAVESASDGGSDLPDASIVSCITKAMKNLSFPEPEDKKKVSVVFPIIFTPSPASSGPTRVTVRTGGMQNGLILTRLHARYGKDTLGSDLSFRVADPISGGRESRSEDGKLELGATKTTGASSFQGRYAIRHPWPGKIECKEPRRGVWGPRWPDADGGASELAPNQAAAATNLAYAPRNANLATFTNLTAADLGGASTATDAGLGDAGAVEGASPTPEKPASRCGCRVADRTDGAASAFGVLLLGMLASARRSRRT